jgi:hypothetical protein
LLCVVSLLVAAGCSYEHRREVLVPTGPTFFDPNAANPAATLIGVWESASRAAATPDLSTCGNFEWQIRTQTPTSFAGHFWATCGGSLTVSGAGTGRFTGATTAEIAIEGSATIGGLPACAFSARGTGSMDGATLMLPYSGASCLGPLSGVETLRRRTAIPPPPPTDAPLSPPVPRPSAGPENFELSNVTIVGSPDVRGFAITSRITSLAFRSGGVRVEHTRRGQWPPLVTASDGTTQEFTLWVFFNIGGRWFGSGGSRWRPGQTETALARPSAIGTAWFPDPSKWGLMANHLPRPGELVGFMIVAGSTRSDANVAVAERSPVVLVPLPQDGIAAMFPPFAWEE